MVSLRVLPSVCRFCTYAGVGANTDDGYAPEGCFYDLQIDASMFCKSLFGGGGCLSFLVGWFGVGASSRGLVVGFPVAGRGGGRCTV